MKRQGRKRKLSPEFISWLWGAPVFRDGVIIVVTVMVHKGVEYIDALINGFDELIKEDKI